jgi:hypothetical protein
MDRITVTIVNYSFENVSSGTSITIITSKIYRTGLTVSLVTMVAHIAHACITD